MTDRHMWKRVSWESPKGFEWPSVAHMHSEAVTALRDCSIAVFSKRSFANAVCIAKRIFGFEGTYLLHGPVAKQVIAPPCHGGGRRFESDLGRLLLFITTRWDLSSAGRASALQAGGHRFEPCRSHSFFKRFWWWIGQVFWKVYNVPMWLNSWQLILSIVGRAADYKSAWW